jgi:hypothetical protein
MTTPPNDARLWALMIDPLRRLGHDYDTAERTSRQLVALVRRERSPKQRTFAPGDPLPDPAPARLYDVDGEVWEHQDAGNGCYRLTAEARRRLSGRSIDTEGVRVWPFLLDEWGPLTEVLEPDTRGLAARH